MIVSCQQCTPRKCCSLPLLLQPAHTFALADARVAVCALLIWLLRCCLYQKVLHKAANS